VCFIIRQQGRCQLLCKADVPVGRRDIGGNEPGLRRVHHRPACRRCGRNGRSVFRRPQGPPRHERQHCALGSASQIPTGRENFVRAAAVSFIHLSLISRTGAACAAANGSGGSSLRPRAGGEPAAAERASPPSMGTARLGRCAPSCSSGSFRVGGGTGGTARPHLLRRSGHDQASASSRALASLRSGVWKPSVNAS
jgi:hypothetical protein